jgi:hypothetical protein
MADDKYMWKEDITSQKEASGKAGTALHTLLRANPLVT